MKAEDPHKYMQAADQLLVSHSRRPQRPILEPFSIVDTGLPALQPKDQIARNEWRLLKGRLDYISCRPRGPADDEPILVSGSGTKGTDRIRISRRSQTHLHAVARRSLVAHRSNQCLKLIRHLLDTASADVARGVSSAYPDREQRRAGSQYRSKHSHCKAASVPHAAQPIRSPRDREAFSSGDA